MSTAVTPAHRRRRLRERLLRHAGYAGGVLAVSLVVGTWGYVALGGQALDDAFLNAAMLLGGMGQVGEVHTRAGKLFAALFSLYAGIMLIGLTGLLLAPLYHHFLRRFHLEDEG